MGRWRAATNFVARIVAAKSRSIPQTPLHKIHIFSSSSSVQPRIQFLNFRSFSAAPATYPQYVDDFEYNNNLHKLDDDEEIGKIPVKAYFLCTRFFLISLLAWTDLWFLRLFHFYGLYCLKIRVFSREEGVCYWEWIKKRFFNTLVWFAFLVCLVKI